MEKIRELLGRLSELSGEELTELRGLIVAEGERLDGEPTTPENVTLLNELAEGGEKVMAEESAKAEAQEKAEGEAKSAKERLAKLNGDASEEGDGDGEAEEKADEPAEATKAEDESAKTKAGADEDAEGEGEEDEDAEAEGAEDAGDREAVTASGRKGSGVAAMARRQRAPQRSPESGSGGSGKYASIVASGAGIGEVDLSSMAPGEARLALGESMADTLRRMSPQAPGRGGAATIVASVEYDYPEERQLSESNIAENDAKLEAAVGLSAIVASGGTCLPGNVDYAVPTWASAARPLRDGLASFQATRGAIRFVQPPDIGALEGATTIWTEATDVSPGANTKPVIAVTCGTEELVYVDAIPTRLAFGNMMGRFSPEQVAANTELAMAAAARIAENNILNKIQALAVKNMTSAKTLGATRDLITAINQASAAFRWTHRIDRGVKLTAVFPDWLKDVLRIDLARELAHDNDNDRDVLAVTDEQIDALLKAHGINPIWHLDGQPQKGSEYPLQGFAAQATGALQAFPTKIVWYLFPEGVIQFLDGGRLDLGVVRDATLDATNDYETFIETFEGIANRGFSKAVLQLVTELCANGQSGATATVSTCA